MTTLRKGITAVIGGGVLMASAMVGAGIAGTALADAPPCDFATSPVTTANYPLAGQTTVTFCYNGSSFPKVDPSRQSWTVPDGVTSVTVTADGAQGGEGGYYTTGGIAGNELTATFNVTPGDTYTIEVGGRGGAGYIGTRGEGGWASGWPGAGDLEGVTGDGGGGGGGGGATAIWNTAILNTYNAPTLYLAAGGGGGEGGAAYITYQPPDGNGGGGGGGGGSYDDAGRGDGIRGLNGQDLGALSKPGEDGGQGPDYCASTYVTCGTPSPKAWFGSGQLTITYDLLPTTTTVVSSAQKTVFGEAFSLTATVSPNPSTDAGFVGFKVNGAGIDGCDSVALTVNGDSAVCTISTLAQFDQFHASGAAYNVTATYTDTDTTPAFIGSTSAAVEQEVGKVSTLTSLGVQSPPGTAIGGMTYGQSITLHVTIDEATPSTVTPAADPDADLTGYVTFLAGTVDITATCTNTDAGKVSLVDGHSVATCTLPNYAVDAGSHPFWFVVDYWGSSDYGISPGGTPSFEVSPAETAVTLTSSPNPSIYGQGFTVTATVTAVAPSGINPTSGQVEFFIDSTGPGTGQALCTTDQPGIYGSSKTLDGTNTASCTFDSSSNLTVSDHTITAVYTPDSDNYNSSAADPVTQVIEPAQCPVVCYVSTGGNDTTGDGTQAKPFRTIQHGVDTTAANYGGSGPGGTVVVAAGTYYESVHVSTPMTLQGAGAGQDARTYSGPRTVINSKGVGSGDGIDVSLSDDDLGVTIDGFWFEGNSSGVYLRDDSSDSKVINNTFFNNAQGIYTVDDQNVLTIQNNVFYWNRNQAYEDPGYGIYVDGSVDDSLIDSNTFSGNNAAAISFTGDGDSEDTTISNNTSTGDGHFAVLRGFYPYEEGQCLGYDEDTLICDNTVTQALGDAIVVGAGTADFNIDGNTISRGNGAAIAFTDEGADGIDISNNLISANQYGINLEAGGGTIVIKRNQFISNRTAGINVGKDFSTAELDVDRNSFVSNRAGLVNQGGVEKTFNAQCNFWNSQNGPRIASNPGAWGDTIAGIERGNYQPWYTTADINGNCDGHDPSVTISYPTETNYAIRERVTPHFTCTDGDSGIASCQAYVNTGSVYDASTAKPGYYFSTNVAGTFTYTVIAIDHAGNIKQESVTYTVGNVP